MKKILTFLLIVVLFSPTINWTQQKTMSPTKKILKAVYSDVTPALRDMKKVAAGSVNRTWKEKGVPNSSWAPNKLNILNKGIQNQGLDPVVQKTKGMSSASAPITNWEGIGNLYNVYPPDTDGDVGLNHYLQTVNMAFAIYSKSGQLLYGPVDNSTLWQGMPNNSNDGDPIALYDEIADRWLMSQFSLPNYPNGPFYENIAISQTSDPTGAWYRYQFEFAVMPDYPKFGVWPDGYYMTINEFANGSYDGAGVVAFNRDKMLAGDGSAEAVYFSFAAAADPWSMLPADFDGTPPPAGTPNPITYACEWSGADRLEIYNFHVDWTNMDNSTLTGPIQLLTAPFDGDLCGYERNCIPQPNTAQGIDPLNMRLMFRLQYRNFGSYQAMVACQTVDADGSDHAGIRWYELRKQGADWEIYQQGTYAPDDDHRFMGSIAMDGNGNIALGYSISSSTVYPSIRYVGRTPSAPLGTMNLSEATIMNGSGSQTGSAARWGDYSMMSVDPSNQSTFWYTQQYIENTGAVSWQTRIASFQMTQDLVPPAQVSNLDATNVGSTYINLYWIAVGDDGNSGTAAGYDIRYSTNPIVTETDWNNATQIADEPIPRAAGTYENYMVHNLAHLTQYYFALKVMDDQGNYSPMSNVVTLTTLGDPAIAVNPASLISNLFTGQSETQLLNITNNSNQHSSLDYLVVMNAPPRANPPAPRQLSDAQKQKLAKDINIIGRGKYPKMYALANAGVDLLREEFEGGVPPAGWTVTDNAGEGIVWKNNTDEGYDNYTGGSGNCATASSDNTPGEFDTELRSPQVNISGILKNIYLTYKVNYQNYGGLDFLDLDISVDGGTSWTNIISWNEDHGVMDVSGEEVTVKLDDYLSDATAFMLRWHYYDPNSDDWDWYAQIDDVAITADEEWLSYSPINGSIFNGTSQNINVTFNAAGAPTGTYTKNLRILSNVAPAEGNPIPAGVVVPCTLNVTGAPDIAAENTLNFGDVFYGGNSQLSLVVKNLGTEILNITGIAANTPQYVPDVTTLSLNPSQSQTVNVTFTPSGTGTRNGILTISSNDPDESSFQVALLGNGLQPPDIAVNPTTLSASLLTGLTTTKTLTISNTGANPLTFGIAIGNIPNANKPFTYGKPATLKSPIKRTNDSQIKISAATTRKGDIDKIKRTRIPGAEVYTLDDGSSENSIGLGAGSDLMWLNAFEAVPGQEMITSIALTWGMFDAGDYPVGVPTRVILYEDPDNDGDPTNAVYLTEATVNSVNPNTDIFTTVPISPTTVEGVFFVAALIQNQAAEIYPAPLDQSSVYQGASWVTGGAAGSFDVNNLGNNALTPILIGDAGFPGNWLLRADGSSAWLSANPSSGVVQPNGSVNVTVTFNAYKLNAGTYNKNLVISNNDPDENPTLVPCTLNVTAAPDIAASTNLLEYGQVYLSANSIKVVTITNEGYAQLNVTSVTSSSSEFTCEQNNFSLNPGESIDLNVKFTPAMTGQRAGNLVLANNDPNENPVTIQLTGEGMYPPSITVNPTSFNETLYSEGQVTRQLVISNGGYNPLTYNLSVNIQEPDVVVKVKVLEETGKKPEKAVQYTIKTIPVVKDNSAVKAVEGKNKISPSYVKKDKKHELKLHVRTPDAPTANKEVLVLCPDPDPSLMEIILEVFGDVNATIFSGDFSAINVDTFLPYDVVFVYNDYTWASAGGDPNAIGNALADYIDAGGKVITNLYVNDYSDWCLGGRFISENYGPFTQSTTDNWSETELGTVYLPGHPVMNGVSNVSQTWGIQDVGLTPGATRIADWDDGNIFIAANENVIAFNILPLDGDGYTTFDGDLDILYNNAINSFTKPWLAVDPTNGTVPAGSSVMLNVTFSAKGKDPGTYTGNINISSNDPIHPEVVVPAELNILPGADVSTVNSITFDPTLIGSSDLQGFTITNNGVLPLTISNLTTNNTEFVVGVPDRTKGVPGSPSDAGYTIGVGESADFVVGFYPTQRGERTGTLIITSNDPDESPYNIALSGFGLSYQDIAVSPLTFNEIVTKDRTKVETLNILNEGDFALNYSVRIMSPDRASSPVRELKSSKVITSNASKTQINKTKYDGFSHNTKTLETPSLVRPINHNAGDVVLTHSVSQEVINGNSVACSGGGITTQNSYWRSFNLPDFGITGDFSVSSVEIGIEIAEGAGGTQPLTVNLYTSNPAFPGGVRTLIGTQNFNLPDQALTVVSLPVTAEVPPGSELVVEINNPAGNRFWIGSNNLGQTAPSYLSASDCGIANPTDVASIGFPNMHTVMNVVGSEGAAITWLTANPVTGSIDGNDLGYVYLTFNSNGLSVGQYQAVVKVTSNDPDEANTFIPVTMTVTSQEIAWLNGLTISDGASAGNTTTSPNATKQSLVFGQSPSATDNIDPLLGEEALPEIPAAGTFDARFVITDEVGTANDYRNDGNYLVTWKLQFQPGTAGYPMKLSWNPSLLPSGSFMLKDYTGNIVNVDMKSTDSYLITDASMNTLYIMYDYYQTLQATTNNGWNVLSVPVKCGDMHASSVYAGSSSPAFVFENGYVQKDILENGKGYWINFNGTQKISYRGEAVNTPITVKEGWNIIGAYNKSIPVTSVVTDPVGILQSQFFGFDSMYCASAYLEPGKGYWVKVSKPGTIYWSGSLAKGNITLADPEVSDEWTKIVVEDANRQKVVLYVSTEQKGYELFDLPPVPPTGSFDVRFSNDKNIISMNDLDKELAINSAAYPIRITVQGEDLRFRDKINGRTVDKVVKSGSELVLTNSKFNKLIIEKADIPLAYELMQNYPNPFNPSTVIKFGIPQAGSVKLAVYDLLGQKVKDLINEKLEAGYHEVVFDAGNYPSGVYIYKVESGSFSSVKKMMLLK